MLLLKTFSRSCSCSIPLAIRSGSFQHNQRLAFHSAPPRGFPRRPPHRSAVFRTTQQPINSNNTTSTETKQSLSPTSSSSSSNESKTTSTTTSSSSSSSSTKPIDPPDQKTLLNKDSEVTEPPNNDAAAAAYNNKSIHELPFTSPFFNYDSKDGSGIESIKSSKDNTTPNTTPKRTFEQVLKNDTTPLHAEGHCSLEDRDGSEVLNLQEKNSPKSDSQEASSITTDDLSQKAINDLPSVKEAKSFGATKWLNSNLDKLQRYIFTASQTLNDFTGYSSIGALKKSIERQESFLADCRERVRTSKERFAQAIASRSASQREVNELLQRKHMWSPPDLERFTELYRSDHTNAHAEADAEKKLAEAERESEEAQNQLSRLISARYHEEQIWSDKIRRASTWGTWGLMGINIFLFIIVQLFVEPRKRARMVSSFEDVMEKHFEEQKSEQQAILAAAVAGSTKNADAKKDEESSATWSQDDRKVLERISELAESENQMLQRLTAVLPGISEPAEIFSDEELTSSPFAESELSSSSVSIGSLPPGSLTWKNLPHRLLGDIIPFVKSRVNGGKKKAQQLQQQQETSGSLPSGDDDDDGHGNAIITNKHYELPEALVVRPIEFAGVAGAGAMIGVLLGVLVTLIAKN
ncbi:uncharacterized protein SAPINGB_P000686 [Magnusiomyces paraingens]|uniref:Sensitive to high expression protein 9, mitochondrial n=1 Tax=Magnusiomyces paraingens TaxID=2606893 RepID=A0A5E8B2X0_9ASCO|nr:uncharacterized protein SAPINGB_P000686 [Saprochaete ingens]VVT45246.1 unnamed protein product [Saprochaete ingens]